MPCSAHECRIVAQRFDPQIGKLEPPHLMSRTGIGRAVAIERRLPTIVLLCAREKRQLGRIPVTQQEAAEVVTIPGLLLGAKYVFDFRLRVWVGGTERGLGSCVRNQQQEQKIPSS